MIEIVGVVDDGAGVAVTVMIVTVGVCDDIAGVAVTIMVVNIGVCGDVGDVTGVAVLSMTAIVGVCGDVADVAVLFMTAIVGMSGGGALTVNMTVVAPAAGTILFAFGAVGMAVARVRTAGNIEIIRPRIVGERLVEGERRSE